MARAEIWSNWWRIARLSVWNSKEAESFSYRNHVQFYINPEIDEKRCQR